MGHSITAMVARLPVDLAAAEQLGLHVIQRPGGFVVLPLWAELVDRWAERLGGEGFRSERPLLDALVLERVAKRVLGPEALYAIVETDYFGGAGDQAAVVYRGSRQVMAPRVARIGPINAALRRLGVERGASRDEFEALGLDGFRSFDDLLEAAGDP